jgi:hypothetical protein
MADRYRFQWTHFEGVQHYSLFEDDVEIVPNIVGTDFDLLFTGVSPGVHEYQLKGYNATSEVSSPVLVIEYRPLLGEIADFRYSVV